MKISFTSQINTAILDRLDKHDSQYKSFSVRTVWFTLSISRAGVPRGGVEDGDRPV